MVFKIYSFFSGGGFLDLGFEESNFEIVLVNEYQKEFIEAYKYSREKMELGTPKYGYFNCDISDFLRKEKKETLTKFIDEDKADGNIIGFIGGPPCPDFSVAGKNKGIDGDNGKLTLAYKKLILQNCPDFFVLENVKGLWKTKKHRIEYEKLKQSFKRKGYVLIDNLVNSLEYGVPQSRERIFMIGIRSSLFKNQEALLEFKTKFTWGKNKTEDLNEILSKNWPLKNEFKENSDAECPNNIIKELTVKFWFDKNDVDFHPNAKDFFNPKSSKIQLIEEGDVSRKSFKRLHRWRYSPTVAYGNNEVHLHPFKARRISIAEALALQSLPKEYELKPEIALTKKFKLVGNGVPYLVGKNIARELNDFLKGIL